MKIRFQLAALALVAAGSFEACSSTGSNSSSDKAQAPEHQMSPEEAAMMQKWMAFATPGEAHKMLAEKAGKWNMKVKSIMAPGAPAQESPGTARVKWIMDGRFLEDHTQGDMGGMPFVGLGHMGYDNMKKKFVGTWMDNMGTGIMTMEGNFDEASKMFVYKTEMPDVETGGYIACRTTEKMIDKDHWVMSMYRPGPDGKEFMTMEIDYTRAK